MIRKLFLGFAVGLHGMIGIALCVRNVPHERIMEVMACGMFTALIAIAARKESK